MNLSGKALRCGAILLAILAQGGGLSAAVVPGWDMERWTVREGLPSDSINDLLQSRDGYLWIATWNGLARFDGVRFVRYDTSTHPDLASNRLTTIHESSDGSLWLSTEQHQLVRYRNGEFRTYGERDGLPGNEIYGLHLDAEGTLWAGGNSGVARFSGDRWEPFAPELIRERVLSVMKDRAGNFWIGTSFAGIKHIGKDGRFTVWDEKSGLDAREILDLLETSSGEILAGTTEGLFKLVDGRWQGIELGPGHPAIHAIEEGDGGLWLATAGGIIHGKDGRFQRETNSAPWVFRRDGPFSRDRDGVGWSNSGNRLDRLGVPVFETSDLITSTLHDTEGNVWVGSWDSGLYRIGQSRFTIYGNEQGLASDKVYPITQDDAGSIWVGTLGGGLARFEDGRFEVFTPPILVYSIAQDSSGALWVGGDKLCVFEDGRCSSADLPRLLREAVEVRAIFEDSLGRLWMGAKGGLLRRKNGVWQELGPADGVSGAVRVLAESEDGAVWMGTNGSGLLRYRNGAFEQLTTAGGLPSDVIRSLHEFPRGTLWVGTEERGLARLENIEGPVGQIRIDTIDRRAGLFSDGIHQILEGGDGRIWMSSNDGIFRVPARQLLDYREGGSPVQSIAYTEADGISEPNGGVQGAGIRARDGRLWFPTQGGVAVVDPIAPAPRSLPPPVIIESIRSGDAVFPAGARADLEPGQRSFQIDYTAISFADAGRIRFRYRLEGYDAGWVDAGQRRSAYYTKVPAGRYRFVVQARRADGSWSEGGVVLPTIVRPYLRETIWFRILMLALLAVLIASTIFWRTRRLARRQRELEAIVVERTASLHREKARTEEALARVEEQNKALGMLDHLKTRFFSDASHELRTPLTLIAGPLTDLLEEKHGPIPSPMRPRLTIMKRNTLRLHRLVNQMLDLHRLEAGGLKLERRTRELGAFVREVVSAFFPLAERHGIEVILDLPDPPCFVSFDADQMEKIVANLMSNSMKYAPRGGRIRVTVGRRDDASAELAVADDGSGIPAGEVAHVFDRFYRGAHGSAIREGTGIGLALVHELVQQHGGTITVRSEPHVETVFIVRLPISHEDPWEGDEPAAERPPAEWDGADEVIDPAHGEDTTTVLVAEDNHDVRNYIREILSPHYRVVTAVDGRQALEAVTRELPDLVISDVLMPNMDGLSFCRALRENPETECIPVILLTALASSGDEVAGIRTGADEYLVKPFSSDSLRARVEGLLAQRQRLRKKMRAEVIEEYSRVRPPAADSEGVTARVRSFILEHLHEEDFNVERLAGELAMSRSTLHRALRSEGTTATELLRLTRLERAAELLLAGSGSISEIGYAVGFQSLAHFSRSFRQQFSVSPSQYASIRKSGADRDESAISRR